ncbi:hypothetical protein GEMRC1_004382 [Eukaryota sp. GEM-RC1]
MDLLAQTLDPTTQEQATKQLQVASRQPGFTKQLLDFIGQFQTQDFKIIQAAAILFKNNIKKFWPDENHPALTKSDRSYIKEHIVKLMLSVNELIRLQLSDAIATIADSDYPSDWPTLRDELVTYFSSTNPNHFLGSLATFEAIFRKYSTSAPNDELLTEMLFVLEDYNKFCKPFLELFRKAVDAFTSDPKMKIIQNVILYSLDIIYHLCSPDLPEFFVQNFKNTSPTENLLVILRTLLIAPDDEPDADRTDSPSNNLKIKEKVCELLRLYGLKYESDFQPFVDHYLQDVFQLLSSLSDAPRFDSLTISATLFLDSIARSTHKQRFNNKPVIEAVIKQVCLPLLTYRDEDVELTEDDPRQFMLTDLETGLVGESSSRRGAATELIRALVAVYPADVIAISQSLVEGLIASQDWKVRVSAVLLVLAIGVQKETPARGATDLVSGVDMIGFFNGFVKKQLLTQQSASSPLMLIICIRFFTVVRSFFPKETVTEVFPVLINFLASESFIVHSYAAWAVDKLLVLPSGIEILNNSAHVGQLLDICFTVFSKKHSNLNEFVMKLIMSVIASSSNSVLLPHAEKVVHNLLNFSF